MFLGGKAGGGQSPLHGGTDENLAAVQEKYFAR